MVEDLKKLYNTLLMIETKGNNTKIMAECLRFTEKLIEECPKTDVHESSKTDIYM